MREKYFGSDKQKGIALPTVIIIIAVLLIIGVSLLAMSTASLRQAVSVHQFEQRYFAAESGVQIAAHRINERFRSGMNSPGAHGVANSASGLGVFSYTWNREDLGIAAPTGGAGVPIDTINTRLSNLTESDLEDIVSTIEFQVESFFAEFFNDIDLSELVPGGQNVTVRSVELVGMRQGGALREINAVLAATDADLGGEGGAPGDIVRFRHFSRHVFSCTHGGRPHEECYLSFPGFPCEFITCTRVSEDPDVFEREEIRFNGDVTFALRNDAVGTPIVRVTVESEGRASAFEITATFDQFTVRGDGFAVPRDSEFDGGVFNGETNVGFYGYGNDRTAQENLHFTNEFMTALAGLTAYQPNIAPIVYDIHSTAFIIGNPFEIPADVVHTTTQAQFNAALFGLDATLPGAVAGVAAANIRHTGDLDLTAVPNLNQLENLYVEGSITINSTGDAAIAAPNLRHMEASENIRFMPTATVSYMWPNIEVIRAGGYFMVRMGGGAGASFTLTGAPVEGGLGGITTGGFVVSAGGDITLDRVGTAGTRTITLNNMRRIAASTPVYGSRAYDDLVPHIFGSPYRRLEHVSTTGNFNIGNAVTVTMGFPASGSGIPAPPETAQLIVNIPRAEVLSGHNVYISQSAVLNAGSLVGLQARGNFAIERSFGLVAGDLELIDVGRNMTLTNIPVNRVTGEALAFARHQPGITINHPDVYVFQQSSLRHIRVGRDMRISGTFNTPRLLDVHVGRDLILGVSNGNENHYLSVLLQPGSTTLPRSSNNRGIATGAGAFSSGSAARGGIGNPMTGDGGIAQSGGAAVTYTTQIGGQNVFMQHAGEPNNGRVRPGGRPGELNYIDFVVEGTMRLMPRGFAGGDRGITYFSAGSGTNIRRAPNQPGATQGRINRVNIPRTLTSARVELPSVINWTRFFVHGNLCDDGTSGRLTMRRFGPHGLGTARQDSFIGQRINADIYIGIGNSTLQTNSTFVATRTGPTPGGDILHHVFSNATAANGWNPPVTQPGTQGGNIFIDRFWTGNMYGYQQYPPQFYANGRIEYYFRIPQIGQPEVSPLNGIFIARDRSTQMFWGSYVWVQGQPRRPILELWGTFVGNLGTPMRHPDNSGPGPALPIGGIQHPGYEGGLRPLRHDLSPPQMIRSFVQPYNDDPDVINRILPGNIFDFMTPLQFQYLAEGIGVTQPRITAFNLREVNVD